MRITIALVGTMIACKTTCQVYERMGNQLYECCEFSVYYGVFSQNLGKWIKEKEIPNKRQHKFGIFEVTLSGLLRSLTPCIKRAKLDQWHTSTPAFSTSGHRLGQKIDCDE